MTSRRGFLGALGALLAMPVMGKITPAAPKAGRGMTTSIFHVDEAPFQLSTGKAGQVLVAKGNGVVAWEDPPQYIVSDMKRKDGGVDTSMYVQQYNIPLNNPNLDLLMEKNHLAALREAHASTGGMMVATVSWPKQPA